MNRSLPAHGSDLGQRDVPVGVVTFLDKVRRTIRRYRMVEDGDLVVVAVSGGPDSLALLHVLRLLRTKTYPRLRLHVAHLNHRLRGEESDADEEFVRHLAEELGLPVTTARMDVAARARAQRRNVEDVGREIRYQFLRTVARDLGADRIATGHTLTDQAETVLLRLVRGTGGDGLSAIHPVVDHLIIRPLLGVRREETRDFCQQLGIAVREDRTNLSLALSRNRIRLEVLPLLNQLNPQVVEALGRAAENLRLDEEYFDEVVRCLWPELTMRVERERVALSVERLNTLHPAIRWRVIRRAVAELKGHWRRLTHAHYMAVDSLLANGRSGRQIELPLGVRVQREFDALIVSFPGEPIMSYRYELAESQPVQAGEFTITLRRGVRAEEAVHYTGSIRLDERKLPRHLAVRNRRPGDRYVPAGRHHPRKVKTLMHAARIPLSQRAWWPLVVTSDDQIVCAPELPPAAAFVPDETTDTFALITFSRLGSQPIK
ncbi:MAG TPA: tRNA lysidine(34) synthetase TilS [Blastocatellia bacterium]|nr:tRNA lysidine(34) synthetase TilS [Blastocatellia bacterium]